VSSPDRSPRTMASKYPLSTLKFIISNPYIDMVPANKRKIHRWNNSSRALMQAPDEESRAASTKFTKFFVKLDHSQTLIRIAKNFFSNPKFEMYRPQIRKSNYSSWKGLRCCRSAEEQQRWPSFVASVTPCRVRRSYSRKWTRYPPRY